MTWFFPFELLDVWMKSKNNEFRKQLNTNPDDRFFRITE